MHVGDLTTFKVTHSITHVENVMHGEKQKRIVLLLLLHFNFLWFILKNILMIPQTASEK